MSDKKRRRSIDLSAADHLHVNKKLKNKKSDFESQLEDIVFGTTSTILTSNQVDDLNNEGEDESNNELIRTDNNNKKSGKSSNKNKGKVQKKQILFEENSEESEDSDNVSYLIFIFVNYIFTISLYRRLMNWMMVKI